MSLLDHVQDVAFSSSIPTDLILGTYTGSVVAPAPAAIPFTKTSTSVTISTSIAEKTFFQGIFSTDGGVTWIDFNGQIPNNTNPATVALQTQMMYGRSVAGSLILTADNYSYFNGFITTVAAYTFLYKVVIFASPDQGDVTAQNVINPLNFDSRYNYQKISRDSVFPFSFPAGGTSSANIVHNLGYIPKVRSFVDNFSYLPGNISLYDFGYFMSEYLIFQMYISTTTLTYFIDNTAGVSPITGTLYTRIYYDN